MLFHLDTSAQHKVHCRCASKAKLLSSQIAPRIKSDSLSPKYPTVHCDPANGWQAIAHTSAPTPGLDHDFLTTLNRDPTQAQSPCDAGCQERQDLINVYTYASSLDITCTSSRKQKQLDRSTKLTKSHTYARPAGHTCPGRRHDDMPRTLLSASPNAAPAISCAWTHAFAILQ